MVDTREYPGDDGRIDRDILLGEVVKNPLGYATLPILAMLGRGRKAIMYIKAVGFIEGVVQGGVYAPS